MKKEREGETRERAYGEREREREERKVVERTTWRNGAGADW